MSKSLLVGSGLVALILMCLVLDVQAAEIQHRQHHHSVFRSRSTRKALHAHDDDDVSEEDEADEEAAEGEKEAGGAKVGEQQQAKNGMLNKVVAEEKKDEEKLVAEEKKETQEVKKTEAEAAQKSKAEAEEETAEKDVAAKEGEVDEAVEETQAALEVAKQKKKMAKSQLDAFKDDEAFDSKIAGQVKLIANETAAPALSSFLGALRREVRAFAKPTYPAYLEAKDAAAEKRVKELEAELVNITGEEKEEKEKANGEKKKAEKLGKEAENNAEETERKVGETWAISFFATVALLAVVFAMASTGNAMVKNYTWFLIDQVIVIFLAVMYFQAFDSLLDIHTMVSSAITASIIHALIMLAMVLTAAYVLRGNELGLAIICGAGAHVVSFSSIHAASGLQNFWVGISYTWLMCIVGLVVLGLGLAIVGYLVHTAKKHADLLQQGAFMDKTDDLENDFGAMAFSVVFTMFVRFLLTGHHPVDDETEFDHSATERGRMFIYACVCVLIAGFTVTFCSQKAAQTDNYAVKRIMAFCNTVSTMNVAWAFLYWGEWEFFGNLFPGEAVKGRVLFAIAATIICGLVVVGLTKLAIPSVKAGMGKNDKLVALTALGLVIAWSWELCFDAAVEDMTEGTAHPTTMKIGTTLALFAIVLPVYALYVKPITGPAADAIGA